jgi:hypothetical protein
MDRNQLVERLVDRKLATTGQAKSICFSPARKFCYAARRICINSVSK